MTPTTSRQILEQILVVDFGGQTSHLICRRLRDHSIYAQIISPLTPVFEWMQEGYSDLSLVKGLIFSGSPFSVYEAGAPQPHPQILALAARVPTLGICYGLHWMAQHLGGEVEALERKEYGPNPVDILAPDQPLLQDVPLQFTSWMSHADSLKSLPPKFKLLGQSEHGLPAIICSQSLSAKDSALATQITEGLLQLPLDPRPHSSSQPSPALHSVRNESSKQTQEIRQEILEADLKLYGLQFHPEVSHCEAGEKFLVNFAQSICACAANWALESWEQSIVAEIREKIASSPVVLLISGGVDSSVVAALLLKHLPAEQVHLLYFDTGLMRLGETDQVVQQLRKLGAKNFHQINAKEEFISALAGVADPEKKRSIIGDLFISIQGRELEKLFPAKTPYFLAQGTLYTDMIESGMGVGKYAAAIKSHHNVSTPQIQQLRRQHRLVEPLASLYKDEVRSLGETLGLSREITQRQPFPGPGLAIRIVGTVTEPKLELLRSIDALYLETLRELGVMKQIWQAFAVLLPIQSVGVTGDSRNYGPVVAVRAITSVDGMSAEAYPFSAEQLQKISTQISNRFPQVSRVVYDISAKPPATIEWE